MKIRAFAERESDNWCIGREPLETEGAKFSNNLNATHHIKLTAPYGTRKQRPKLNHNHQVKDIPLQSQTDNIDADQ